MNSDLRPNLFSDLVVLDLTRARAGPAAARQFADWGADVILIEARASGAGTELGSRHGADFQNLHRNKRAMALDLKSPDGKAIFMRLAARADVVIENFRPDVKTRLGIDYAALRAINPRIVYGSISGFGQDGPYALRPGLDQIAQGMGGHMSITGEPGNGPMRSGAAIADMFAGVLCANGILMALLERERSGAGQWIHTSLLEAQIFLLDFQAARWLVDGEVPRQSGNDHPTIAPMGVFQTRDGYINVASMPSMWPKFCQTIGLGDLVDHPDFASAEGRLKNRAQLNVLIAARTRAESSADWIERLNDAGIPCGPIYAMDQTFDDPQVRHLEIARNIESPVLARAISLVGQPIHMNRYAAPIASTAPEYGQHTDEILRQFGYTDQEIAGFRAREIV
jgi:formyl-CoA transferase